MRQRGAPQKAPHIPNSTLSYLSLCPAAAHLVALVLATWFELLLPLQGLIVFSLLFTAGYTAGHMIISNAVVVVSQIIKNATTSENNRPVLTHSHGRGGGWCCLQQGRQIDGIDQGIIQPLSHTIRQWPHILLKDLGDAAFGVARRRDHSKEHGSHKSAPKTALLLLQSHCTADIRQPMQSYLQPVVVCSCMKQVPTCPFTNTKYVAVYQMPTLPCIVTGVYGHTRGCLQLPRGARLQQHKLHGICCCTPCTTAALCTTATPSRCLCIPQIALIVFCNHPQHIIALQVPACL